jgi:hypothetical protein
MASQPPPPGGAAGAPAGGGINGVAQTRPWPNVGEQMDMNMLWELVNNLAEVNQGIREQTQGVLQRVQMIQARGDLPSVNGHGRSPLEKTEGDKPGEVNGETAHGEPEILAFFNAF